MITPFLFLRTSSIFDLANYRLPNPPYGMRVFQGRLVVKQTEIKSIRFMMALKNKERSIAEIIASLDAKGIKTRSRKTWTRQGIARVLRL